MASEVSTSMRGDGGGAPPHLVIHGGVVRLVDGALLVERVGGPTDRIPLDGGAGPRLWVQDDDYGRPALTILEGHRSTTVHVADREAAEAFIARVQP